MLLVKLESVVEVLVFVEVEGVVIRTVVFGLNLGSNLGSNMRWTCVGAWVWEHGLKLNVS